MTDDFGTDCVKREAISARHEPSRTSLPAGYRSVALVVASALFMQQMDTSVLTIALPAMARDFDTSAPALSLALTSYLLALAIFIPVSGQVADRLGARTVYCCAIALFLAGSILCARAPDVHFLIGARFVQGIGGAMMVPVGRLLLLRGVARENLVTALSWLVIPALIGPIVGPPVGGFIVTYLDWRWIFYLNLPIGICGIIGALLLLDNPREPGSNAFDFIGFAYLSLALGSLVFGFELASEPHFGILAVILVGLGLALGAVYIYHAHRTPHPVLDLALLNIPTFRLSLIGGSLARITQGAQPFLLPLMFQLGFGLSAAATGAITISNAVGALAMKMVAPRVIKKWGFRQSLIVAGILSSIGYLACGAFRPGWPLPLIVVILSVSGFFMSFLFTAYNALAFADVEPAKMGAATSFYSTFQQLTLSFGICIAAASLHAGLSVGERSQPAMIDFTGAFMVVTLLSGAAWFWNRRYARDAGAGLSNDPATD